MNKIAKIDLAGRDIIECDIYSAKASRNRSKENCRIHPLRPSQLLTNAESISSSGSYISAQYNADTETSSFFVRFIMPRKHRANGLGARIQLRGWESVRVVSVGYSAPKQGIINIKARKTVLNGWFSLDFAHEDLAFRLTNDWIDKSSPDLIEDIRIVVVGTPEKTGASLDIQAIYCWLEKKGLPQWLENFHQSFWPDGFTISCLMNYFKFSFRDYREGLASYLAKGTCPLAYGKASIPWSPYESIPQQIESSVTYRYSWHAWHPAIVMLMGYLECRDLRLLFSARDFANAWLSASYFSIDNDQKYCWYDHGVAERLLGMLLMWSLGTAVGLDFRFMSRLRHAIYRHGQLLSSEAFYAYTQNYRYHNHAWFQDLTLLSTAVCFKDMPCSQKWFTIAIERLEDQLAHLVIRDGEYAVFIENSIGYQEGVHSILLLAGELLQRYAGKNHVADIAVALQRFQDFFSYPDGRLPSQGDTFRKPNIRKAVRVPTPATMDSCILSKAGYGIVKGKYEDSFYMLTMLATSLSQTHKHEDNLSFMFYFDGIEWLIDPSFYSHDYGDAIPKYLRSAKAHNAIFIEAVDYSISPGLASLDGKIEDELFFLNGIHSCYPGIQIEREIKGQTNLIDFAIVDKIVSDKLSIKPHLMFHCGEHVKAEKTSTGVLLSHPGSTYVIELTLPTDLLDITYGNMDSKDLRGLAGHEFMQAATIYTIDIRIGDTRKFEWKMTAKPSL